MKKGILYFLGVLFSFHCYNADAQIVADSSTVKVENLYTISNILITGNKKTKEYIIQREIPFRTGEQYTIAVLTKKFEDAQRQLLNTSLFLTVEIAIKDMDSSTVRVSVKVRERWYFFPGPFFKPVDRNLNQWIVEQKASLSRVNYGIKFTYYNFTGRHDKFRGSFGTGYTKQFSLGYERPYFDKYLRWGYSAGIAHSKNKEVNYNTVKDKQVFVKDDNVFLNKYTNVYANLIYRRKIKTRHSIGLSFTRIEVNDTIVKLNPAYFNGGKRIVAYPELQYVMSYYHVDFNPYPTKGYAAQVIINKKGISEAMNVWQLHLQGSGSWHLGKRSFLNVIAYGGLKLPFKQPYFNQHFLGYGDVYMQGYEYYVVDGVAGGYVKTGLYKELFHFKVKLPPLKKGKDPLYVPFRIVGKTYGNIGYVHNPQPGNNFLSNKMLYSGGFGIDIITFYDIVLKLEYSFNQLGENGLFLHRKSIF